MIAIDTNILVYYHRTENPWHIQADKCITELAEGDAPWYIPYPCLSEFLAIVTNPRIDKNPTPMEKALKELDYISKAPTLKFIAELPGFITVLQKLCGTAKVKGGMIHDAKIAAICLQNGVKNIFTADRDFSRFSDLKVMNPLV